ncbi:lysine efflux permease LysE [Candidatus Kinetoplastibacterium blastocrithidii TCC012E]|uniref:Lysine efflux permease LysE n=1 Tax=Candidatus Kinetoplastidibacterium blastocrithidiae TCC012E TaxID=1208922 RepID=M1M4T8_9PROT|nr:LysE family transporter [Candidatus Kinetoplastibacterium blastocrithidii]AFZ83278.1 L-lysine exporter family protein LysE/ArgO [Candidatus Kinetoplastibacterium blastocrithidii (ex Strigomonas culicis)]AGF50094.1 lysine efflux permease LysE [Candidatus Kinetoplastibacterium blastocrithidii TCC012E]
MPAVLYYYPTFEAWSSGLLTGLSLFAVVGAQSAFILRQGIMRSHIITVITVCALSDAIFITLSVFGLKEIILIIPSFKKIILIFGILFLVSYSYQAAKRSINNNSNLIAASGTAMTRKSAILGALGFSLLNPHFWLDLILIGSLASIFDDRSLAYAFGVIISSILWLIVLGLGSRMFAPFFSSQRSWRVLDGLISILMLFMAVLLALKFET